MPSKYFLENSGVCEITKRRQMTILRMRIACCVTKVTHTHSEYVVHIVFPLLQCSEERGSILRHTFTVHLVLWDVTACNLIEICLYLGGIWSFTFIVEDRRGYIFSFRNSPKFIPHYIPRHVSENNDVFVLENVAMVI
jgi:hypothetical protein